MTSNPNDKAKVHRERRFMNWVSSLAHWEAKMNAGNCHWKEESEKRKIIQFQSCIREREREMYTDSEREAKTNFHRHAKSIALAFHRGINPYQVRLVLCEINLVDQHN